MHTACLSSICGLWPPLGVSTGGGYPRSRGGGCSMGPEIPIRALDRPTPHGHVHPLLVTSGGHHWRHTHPPCPLVTPGGHHWRHTHSLPLWTEWFTDTSENITFLQLRLLIVIIDLGGQWICQSSLDDWVFFENELLIVLVFGQK